MANSLNQVESLEATKRRLELVLEGTRLGMWDWNPQTDEVVFDQRWAEMLGVTLEDLTMTLEDWTSRVHSDDLESCFADIQAHIDGHVDFYENTHRMRHADGTWRYILDRGRVVEWSDQGQPIRFTGTHTDVTPLKEAELRATKALDDRDKFFSHISHELRTPLHGILGITDVLLRQETEPEVSRYLSVIKDSGSVLLSLLNDLLDISKISAGALQLHEEPVDVCQLAEHTTALFKGIADRSGLSLEFVNDTGYARAFVNIDKGRLSQILSNLVSNGVKFTREGGVTVRAFEEDQQLRVTVIDTGVGLADPEQMFQAYVQHEGVHSRDDIQGTGLGLAIVKSLVDAMNLEISCRSKVGQGTEFCLSLGEILCDQQYELQAPLPIATKEDIRFQRVLLVDDNDVNLMVGELMLSEFLPQVDTADCGEQALQMLQADPDYDLVLLDINMPGMNGFDVAARIQQLDQAKNLVVLAQTADVMEQNLQKLTSCGFDGVVSKPFEEAQLRQILARY